MGKDGERGTGKSQRARGTCAGSEVAAAAAAAAGAGDEGYAAGDV